MSMGFDQKYKTLLEHFILLTNEKEKIFDFLKHFLPESSNSYLDIGAGNGELLSLFAPNFNECIAIESNMSFSEDLIKKTDKVYWSKFEDINIQGSFDFILASHVLGYIPMTKKNDVFNKAVSLLNKKGLLVFIYNSKGGDTYKVLRLLGEKIISKPTHEAFEINPQEMRRSVHIPYINFQREQSVNFYSESSIRKVISFLAYKDINNLDDREVLIQSLLPEFKNGEESWKMNFSNDYLIFSKDCQVMNSIKNRISIDPEIHQINHNINE